MDYLGTFVAELAEVMFDRSCKFAQLISLSDLENDFINPYDLTLRLNRFVVGTGRVNRAGQ